MKFYVGQKLKFKEKWDYICSYEAGEIVEVVSLDSDGDPKIEGKDGMDCFFSYDLANLVEAVQS